MLLKIKVSYCKQFILEEIFICRQNRQFISSILKSFLIFITNFFYLRYRITFTGLSAACTLLCILTVQKQFRKHLYKDHTDIQLRYMFAIYIHITRVYN